MDTIKDLVGTQTARRAATASDGDDYAGNTSTAGSLPVGSTASGNLERADDQDWFRLTLEAGTTYRFSLAAGKTGAGTLGAGAGTSMAFLHLLNGAGDFIALANGGGPGGEPLMTFKTVESGAYFISVQALAGLTGSYTLSATDLGHDDYFDDYLHAGALAIGEQAAATIGVPGESDWFKVGLQAGVSYVFEMTGTGAGAATPLLQFYDAAASTLRVADGGASGKAQISYTPAVAGTYFLAAAELSHAATGAYTLKASAAADDYAANLAGSGALTVGAQVSGSIEAAGDRDWFKIALQAGTKYAFQLAGASGAGGTLGADPNAVFSHETLSVLDAHGQAIATTASSTPGAGLILTWSPSATGDYYLQAEDLYGAGTYTLKAAIAEADDFAAGPATAGVVPASGQVSGKLESPGDVDWFKATLKAGTPYVFELLGAPKGKGSYGGEGSTPELHLLDASGKELAGTVASWNGPEAQIVYRPVTAGTFFLSVSDLGGVAVGTYTLTSLAADKDDFAGSVATTGSVAPGALITGNIDYVSDVDWIKVALTAGTSYQFELTGQRGDGGTLGAVGGLPILTLVDAHGAWQGAASATGHGGDPLLAYVPAASADYYLQVSALSRGTGSYTLKAGSSAVPMLDTHAPSVLSMLAPVTSRDGGPAANIALSFDERIQLGAGSITLRLANGSIVETFDLATSSRVSVGGEGATRLVIDPTSVLKNATDYVLELPAGSVKDFAGHSYTKLTSHPFRTVDVSLNLQGTSGNDILAGGSGDDLINGGAGTDTLVYRGAESSHYSIARTATGMALKALDGALGADTLTGIERIVFDDQALAFDIDGAGGQAYRLYRAAFNREPDLEGVGFWISRMDQGTTLNDVSGQFIASAEFTALYGTAPSDQTFVGKLYDNVLHRQPDQAGMDYWIHVLHDGHSREFVLGSFSESAENKAAVITVIGDGFAYIPFA